MKTVACSDCAAAISCGCDGGAYDKDHSHYGLGAIRCKPCSDAADAIWRAERIKKEDEQRARIAAHISAGCPDDGEVCENCCEHEFDPDEGFMCLNCNKQKYG